MKVTKYSQSTFLFEAAAGDRLLLDPGNLTFNEGFPAAAFGPVGVIVITHRHADHFDPEAVRSLAAQSMPVVVTNPDVARLLQREMVGCRVWQVGDQIKVGTFTLTCITADHVVNGEYVVNFGVVIEANGARVYHTSDTRFLDPQFLPVEARSEPDLLCVPISNRGLVMSIDDALYFANELRPRLVVPMHYDSPRDRERIRPEHFVERLRQLQPSLPHLSPERVRVLAFGASVDL